MGKWLYHAVLYQEDRQLTKYHLDINGEDISVYKHPSPPGYGEDLMRWRPHGEFISEFAVGDVIPTGTELAFR